MRVIIQELLNLVEINLFNFKFIEFFRNLLKQNILTP